MANRLPLTDKDGEVRELTDEDRQAFQIRPGGAPPELLAVLPKRGWPLAKAPKQAVNIRLSPDILAASRATGQGWQTRLNAALCDWLREHKPA